MEALTRDQIIKLLKNTFFTWDSVHALWLEGSDGLGRADEYSDLDFWFDADDGQEEAVLSECMRVLETAGRLDFVEHYNHPHPKIFQKTLHLEGTSAYLLLDLCVQSHSRGSEGCTFVENDIAEYPLVLFDKAGVVRIVPPPPDDTAAIAAAAKQCVCVFAQRSRVVKYLRRGRYLEAFAYYQKYVCTPVVTMQRLLHTPRHLEYGPVHISDHLPAEAVKSLEALYQCRTISDIEERLPLADALFSAAKEALRQKYGDMVFPPVP